MEVKKLTKEEQDIRLKVVSSKVKVNKKPSFSEWLMHDKTAFRIIFLIGLFGGLIVTIGLFTLSLVFDYNIFFKVLFGVMMIGQIWNMIKMWKAKKNVDMTINDMVYKGKYDKSKYETKRQQYDASKGVAA